MPSYRRRNPDPPETLTQYRGEEFAAALSRAGARVKRHPWAGIAFDIDYEGAQSTMWFGMAFPSFTSLNYLPLQRTARLLAPVAESLGEILTYSWPGAAFPEFIAKPHGLRIFLPSGVKNKRSVASAVHIHRWPGTGYGSSDRAYAMLPKIEKALAEARSRDVPKKYRKQVEELFQQAFADDDLATYIQARDLAALVSE